MRCINGWRMRSGDGTHAAHAAAQRRRMRALRIRCATNSLAGAAVANARRAALCHVRRYGMHLRRRRARDDGWAITIGGLLRWPRTACGLANGADGWCGGDTATRTVRDDGMRDARIYDAATRREWCGAVRWRYAIDERWRRCGERRRIMPDGMTVCAMSTNDDDDGCDSDDVMCAHMTRTRCREMRI